MKIIRTHIVPTIQHPIRLENYIRENFKEYPSRKGIQKSIKRGLILLDHQQVSPGVWLREGHRIDWLMNDEINFIPYKIDVDVVFEDDYLAIINKPSGIIVSGNRHRTITHSLPVLLKKSSQIDALLMPQPAHRIDGQTSGLLLVAKTSSVLIALNQLFEKKRIKKEYTAIVQGEIDPGGVIDDPIEGKQCFTKYTAINISRSLNNKWVSVVRLWPKTGRTHQLRIHLSAKGFPIIGDRLYGKEGNVLKGKGLFLCASGMEFVHPVTSEVICCSIDPPKKFDAFLKREKIRWENYNKSTEL